MPEAEKWVIRTKTDSMLAKSQNHVKQHRVFRELGIWTCSQMLRVKGEKSLIILWCQCRVRSEKFTFYAMILGLGLV